MFGRWFWIFNAFWFVSMLVFGVLLARYENANYELTVFLLISVTGSTIMSRLDSLKSRTHRSDPASD